MMVRRVAGIWVWVLALPAVALGQEKPPTPQELVQQANEAFNTERFAAAERLYEASLEEPRDPKKAQPLSAENRLIVLQNLGHTRFRLERWEGAIDAYRQCQAPEEMRWIAQCHLRLDNLGHARVALATHLVRFPRDDVARDQLAQVLRMLGDNPAALELYQEMLAAKPGDADLRYTVARLLMSDDRASQALDELEMSWRLGRRDPAMARLLADMYLQREMYLEAAGYYQRYLAAAEAVEAEDYFRVGYAYYLGKEQTSAGEFFEKAVASDSSHARGFLYLGHLAAADGDAAGAKGHYERALAVDPDYAEAHEAIAGGYMTAQDYANAATAYRRALDSGSTTMTAAYNLVVALLRSDQREPAIAALKDALTVHPDRAELLDLIKLLDR